MKIKLTNANLQIEQNINAILDDLNALNTGEELLVSIQKGESGFVLNKNGNNVSITYGRDVELYRAIGILLEREAENTFEAKGCLKFEDAGVMLDNCRNAVMTIDTAKFFVRKLAVMGLNMMMLYMEDTYPVDGEPYFGHFRSRFTKEQLKEIISYANSFGVRVVPAIQTLAHLEILLKSQAYSSVKETDDVLLVGEEKTYELIDKMLSAIRECFGAGPVNVGMDEAPLMGLVGYRKKHGCRDQFDIFMEHLEKVAELCKKYDLEPMIWTDMIWKCAFGGYYAGFELGEPRHPEMPRAIPENVRLVYWDYLTTDTKKFDEVLQKHKDISSKTAYASGGWTWCGFTPSIAKALQNTYAGVKSCINKGVPMSFVTAWGDDGYECSFMAALPTMQLQAELSYNGDVTLEEIEKRFKTCTGENFKDFLCLELPLCTPGTTLENRAGDNVDKYLLYQDLLTGMFDKHVNSSFAEFYNETAEKLSACASRSNMPLAFDSLAKQSRVLALKCDMGLRIKAAYDNDNRAVLDDIANKEIPELLERIDVFYEAFRKLWYSEKKPCGFEVQDLRIGALKSRISAAARRLNEYLAGEHENIEELEEERLYFDARTEENEHLNIDLNFWKKMVTSNIL